MFTLAEEITGSGERVELEILVDEVSFLGGVPTYEGSVDRGFSNRYVSVAILCGKGVALVAPRRAVLPEA